MPGTTLRLLLSVLLLTACGDDAAGPGPDGGGDGGSLADAGPDGVGRIEGTVQSPNGRGLDVVAGARVSIAGGPSAVTDAFGRFALDGVPAGRPITLEVEGPDDGDDVFAPNALRVTVPSGGMLVVLPRILRGCRGTIAPSGGSAGSDRCGGGGAVEVTFPPDAFVTAAGAPVTGPVRVDMAAVDPAVPDDFAGLPRADEGGESVIAGGVHVTLHDAASGEPVDLAPGATASLRFEVASPPEGVAPEITIETFDGTAWVAEGPGTTTTVDGRTFVTRTVDHFTAYRGVFCCIPAPETCMLVNVQACDAAGTCTTICAPGEPCPSRPRAEILDLASGRSRSVELVPDAFGRSCLHVRANAHFDVTFTHADRGQLFVTRRRVASGPVVGSAREPSCPMDCTNLCDVTDRGGFCTVTMTARAFACASGLFLDASGNPITGTVQVLLAGDEVARFTLPEAGACESGPAVCDSSCGSDAACLGGCRASACALVPVDALGESDVTLRDRDGHTISFTPDPTPPGRLAEICPATRPLACGATTPDCLDLGVQQAACDDPFDTMPRGCSRARFTWTTASDTPLCPGADNHELRLDGTPSTGDIVEFAWRVELSGGLTWTHTGTTPVPPVRCIRDGSQRVELRTRVRSYRGHTNRIERVITVGPLPCEARISSTIPSAATTCLYDFAAATPHRRCTRADGATTTFDYDVSRPCGFPCLTGTPTWLGNGWTFDPVPHPVAEIRTTPPGAPTRVGRIEYERDELGNVVAHRQWDPAGTLIDDSVYDYDDPGRPSRVVVTSTGATGTRTVLEHRLSWDRGRLSRFAITYDDGTLLGDLEYRYDAEGRLLRVAWLRSDLFGGLSGVFDFTHDPGETTVQWTRTGAAPSETITYDYVCP